MATQERLDYVSKFIDQVTDGVENIELATLAKFKERVLKRADDDDAKLRRFMVNKALDNIDPELTSLETGWTFVASRILLDGLYEEAAKNRGYNKEDKYGDFYELLTTLAEKGQYTKEILDAYTEEEIRALASKLIDPNYDLDYNYIGLYLFEERYLAKDYHLNLYELPVERYLINALYLMQNEDTEKRHHYVEEAFWVLANKIAITATPTMGNAGRTHGQLSSCFIDTVADSLDGIYLNNFDVARLSKDGGGIGVYIGKIRSEGSDIRNFKGVASGQLPWAKQLDNTARSVDQVGKRAGAIVIWDDVWNWDVRKVIIESRLNNGELDNKLMNLSLGLCIPDLFMEKVRDRATWYLFDPYMVEKFMGFRLEDSFDEKKGKGTFRERYQQCVDHPMLPRKKMPAMELMKEIITTQKKTGYPYMFYRDEVNRMNPNKHAGMIYCSNLCTEIAQNMTPTEIVHESSYKTPEGDTMLVMIRKAGDFVVCNLASINLARAWRMNALDRAVPILMRMLDNVIELNAGRITVGQAKATNEKYRAVGLGTFSWHHLLAIKGIEWESGEAIQLADKLYERIAKLAIEASSDLGAEKGNYPAYNGSEWNTGEYFERRGYDSPEWLRIKEKAMKHMRNGWLMAVAPNMSSAKFGLGTDGIDPIFKPVYADKKNNYNIMTPVPDLNWETIGFYKESFDIDQKFSIMQNAQRQRHIDQAISFNMYFYNDVKMSEIYDCHMLAWELGMKTTYYTRTTGVKNKVCEACEV